MSALATPWGYTVEVAGDAIPPILSVEEFRTLTGGRLSSTDEAIEAKIAAVSAAVRSHCGWHVAPALECSCELDGGGSTLWLPCMGVSSVSSVEVAGEACEGFQWAPRGELRLPTRTPDALRCVAVAYVAGFDPAAVPDLAQVVAQVAANDLCAAPGLREEHTGSVGATYNMTESGVSGGVRLLASDRLALTPWRIENA